MLLWKMVCFDRDLFNLYEYSSKYRSTYFFKTGE
jgi:hypothetical protein